MQTIGRYRIQRQLGGGRRGTVYLCVDPKLERPVAIKVVTQPPDGPAADTEAAFEQQARAMGRFQHANIVSVYDVGRLRGAPYIVFEYVRGQPLADLLQAGPLKPGRALELFEGMVSGVAEAHRAGVIHYDLRPENVLVSESGAAKIADFGIAQLARAADAHGAPHGEPAWTAPEALHGLECGKGRDVFALGAMLYQMLTAKRAFAGDTATKVLAAMDAGPPAIPSAANPNIDESLAALCLKAVDPDPAKRFADAGQVLAAIHDYQRQRAGGEPSRADGGHSTVDFLYRRMQRSADFPALSDSIGHLNQLDADSREHAENLGWYIVRDFALTNKILKVVNSAYYGRFSGRIGTISRAIVVLGINAIRSIAASLIFFEHLTNQTTATRLKRRAASALHRALLAREIASRMRMREVEEAFVCAMFNELGQVLVAYYLPDEDQEILRLTEDGLTDAEAARQVLGATFNEVGQMVARQWNFPRTITNAMTPLKPGQVTAPRSEEDRLRVVSHFAGELSDAVVREEPEPALEQAITRYQRALGFTQKQGDALLDSAGEEFARLAGGLLAASDGDPHLERMKASPATQETAAATDGASDDTSVEVPASDSAVAGEEEAASDAEAAADTDAVLTDGLQEATNILVDSGDVSQLFNVVLESLYRGMGFRRTALALRQADGCYKGRLGFGTEIQAFLDGFRVDPAHNRDVFSAAITKNVDVYITDVRDTKVRNRLPSRYFQLTDAESFLLMPIYVDKRGFGLIYGEFAKARQVELRTRTFNLVKSLRNQLILALRQQG